MRFKKVLGCFGFVVLVFGAYLFGYFIGHNDLEFEKGFIPKVEKTEVGKAEDIDFSLFWDVWNKLEEKYLRDVDKWQMFYGAIAGMVKGIGDPYTVFLDPAESKKFLEEVKGQFEGVGMELALKNNQLTVVAPLEDSPAEKAGARAGDIIEKIDGKEAASMTLDEAVDAIRGKRGTEVTLTIKRGDQLQEIKITRALIKIKSVKWEMKDDIGYLKVSQFLEDTSKLSVQAASRILSRKPKAIILDLRNNPGGYLDAAVDLASLFVKDGVIVYEEEKSGKRQEIAAKGNAKLADLPLVVLINAGSASGSEIVAGAIQDKGLGKLIGEKTFGKGTVQSLEQLKDGSTLRITIARWLTPSGREINDHGLSPDIEVVLTEEDFNAGRDPQLERAIGELNK